MTDQFSPEYIDYILSDEARALQAAKPLLEWGDAVWVDDNSIGRVGSTPMTERGEYMVAVPRGDIVLALYRTRDELVCFLTLYDLLQIIEGAGWDVASESSWRTGERQYRYVADRPEGESGPYRHLESTWEDDRMLAAAKLAVRAVTKS